ncbi:MAG: GNAT family N-acetyltransferase, partial [Cephaloticoccus sp.]|nr:GNAT family N-acetyltransferase [Cephaloticoccus sp.]
MSDQPFKPLTTPRLRLRRLHPEDVDALCAYRNLPEVARYQSWETFTPTDARRLIADTSKNEPGVPGTWTQLGIIESASGNLIGDCGLHTMPEDKRLLELGITLAPEAQGKGYAKEALQAVIDHCFNSLDAHRLSVLTDADNL